MDECVEKYSIGVSIDRGDGDTLEVKASLAWKETSGSAGPAWCFAMRITEVLGALEMHFGPDEWTDFVRGIKTLGEPK